MATITNQNILITGGSGFIGHHLAQNLASENQVYVLDHRQANISDVAYQLGDYQSLDLQTLLSGIDTVYHLAWRSTPASSSNREFETRFNLEPSKKLIDIAKNAGVKHFIFISSAGAVYGSNPTPFKESQPPKPQNLYGQSKLLIEQHLVNSATPVFQVTIFRPTNAIGLDQRFKLGQGLIPALISSIKTNTSFNLYGNAAKDYLPINDLIEALVLFSNQPKPVGLYNVGSGKLITTTNLVKLAEEIVGHKIATKQFPLAPYDLSKLEVSLSHISSDLGWQPQADPEAYIRRIFTHHLT